MVEKLTAITGIGTISPIGIGKESFSDAIKNGVSGIQEIIEFDTTAFRSKKGAPVRGFDPARYIKEENTRKMDRATSLSVSAAILSVSDSGLDLVQVDRDRIGVVVGTASGGLTAIESYINEIDSSGFQYANPFIFPNTVMNIPAGSIAKELKVRGPNMTLTSKETSGMAALLYSDKLIKNDSADIVICGGVDELSKIAFSSCDLKHDLAITNRGISEDSRPFDIRHNGYVLGEGACFFILEDMSRAINRGAYIYGVLSGITLISIPGQKNIINELLISIKKCLSISQTNNSSIDYISSCANSSSNNDTIEAKSLSMVFGNKAGNIPISSIKSMIGETGGGAGPFALASALLGMKGGFLPPTINLDDIDPVCFLNHVQNRSIEHNAKKCLISCIYYDPLSDFSNSAFAVVEKLS